MAPGPFQLVVRSSEGHLLLVLLSLTQPLVSLARRDDPPRSLFLTPRA